MPELAKLIARRDQLENQLEKNQRVVSVVVAGPLTRSRQVWDEFYRIEGHIEESILIICECLQALLELSSFSLQQEEQMRESLQRTHIHEREAGVVAARDPTT